MGLPVTVQAKYWGIAAAVFLLMLWFFGDVMLPFLVGGAILKLWDDGPIRRSMAVALAGLIVAHNCAYLWIKKYPQYERRAAPTERLLNFSQGVKGPITVKCFPYTTEVAARLASQAAEKSC